MIFRSRTDLLANIVRPGDLVLDIGYADNLTTSHAAIKQLAKEVYGVDVKMPPTCRGDRHYIEANAENFSLPTRFDLIYAGDIIEHLSNPGMFLDSCKRHLTPNGRLVITTPNAFSFFSIVEKITHEEPNVHEDHTLYLNKPTVRSLLQKSGWSARRFDTVSDKLGDLWKGGIKRKMLASVYSLLGHFSEKYMLTMVVTATPSG